MIAVGMASHWGIALETCADSPARDTGRLWKSGFPKSHFLIGHQVSQLEATEISSQPAVPRSGCSHANFPGTRNHRRV